MTDENSFWFGQQNRRLFIGDATAYAVQPSGDGAAFRGRRTGRRYAIPVSYYRDAMTGMVTCMTDASGVWVEEPA